MARSNETTEHHRSGEVGATPVEIGMTVGLIATFIVVAVGQFGDEIAAIFDKAGDAF